MHRRGHRPEIAQAKEDARSLPHEIGELESEHVRLAEEIAAERAAMDRTGQRGSGPTREPARQIVAEIDTDARTRGELAADQPSDLLVAHLGPVPDDPIARDRWVTAAGRIEQHRALWPIRDGQILSSRPRAIGQDDYAFTHHAVQRAVADLDQSLGADRQVPTREAPGIER